MKSTHVLIFKGNGSWKDSEGKIYNSNKEVRIESDLSEEDFLDGRKDIKFMVEYGQLTISTASVGNPQPLGDKDTGKVAKPNIVNTNNK